MSFGKKPAPVSVELRSMSTCTRDNTLSRATRSPVALSRHVDCDSDREQRRSIRWAALSRIFQVRHQDSDSDSESSSDEDEEPTAKQRSQTRDLHFPAPRLSHGRPRRTPSYAHHGHSYSSMQHQKSLWQARWEAWANWQAEQDNSNVYYATSRTSASDSNRPFSFERRQDPPYSRSAALEIHTDPKLKVPNVLGEAQFPRMGDLSNLRDMKQLIAADRYLMNFPIHTLSKMAWSYDAAQRISAQEAIQLRETLQTRLTSAATSSDISDVVVSWMRDDDATEVDSDGNTSKVSEGSSSDSDSRSSCSLSSSGDNTLVNSSRSSDACPNDMKESDESLEDICDTASVVDTVLCESVRFGRLHGHVDIAPRLWEVKWSTRWAILIRQAVSAEQCITEELFPTTEPTNVHVIPLEEEDEDDYGQLVENPVYAICAYHDPFESPALSPSTCGTTLDLQACDRRLRFMQVQDETIVLEMSFAAESADAYKVHGGRSTSRPLLLGNDACADWSDFGYENGAERSVAAAETQRHCGVFEHTPVSAAVSDGTVVSQSKAVLSKVTVGRFGVEGDAQLFEDGVGTALRDAMDTQMWGSVLQPI